MIITKQGGRLDLLQCVVIGPEPCFKLEYKILISMVSKPDKFIVCFRHCSEKSAITTVTSTEASTSEDNKEPEIGPWEKWMITKSESMKKLAQQKSRLERMKKQQAKQQEIERKEREKKAEHIRQVRICVNIH